MVDVHIEHGQKSVWVAFDSIGFDRRAHRRLAQHELREGMQVEVVRFCIFLQKLGEQSLQRLIVDFRIRVEKIEIDIDKGLLGDLINSWCFEESEKGIRHQRKSRQSRPRQFVCVSTSPDDKAFPRWLLSFFPNWFDYITT